MNASSVLPAPHQRSWHHAPGTRWATGALVVLLLVALGLVVGGDYGISIDEPAHVQYGQQTLEAYEGRPAAVQPTVDPRQHGPFYSFVAYLGGSWVAGLRRGWILADGMHFMYYLSFVLSTVFLWILLRRYVSTRVAWIITGAYFTQPVLFGHAFINPKDIPFLAFCLGGLSLGMAALPGPSARRSTDSARPEKSRGSAPGAGNRRLGPWPIPRRTTAALIAWTLLAGALTALLLSTDALLASLQGLLTAAYQGQAAPPVNAVFRWLARNAASAPLQAYQVKLVVWVGAIRWPAVAALGSVTLLAWSLPLWRPDPRFRSGWSSYLLVLAAGTTIGLATSVRAVGPLILAPLVFVYALELRKRSIPLVFLLVGSAAAACVATWPYLWQTPIDHFLQALNELSHFPWTGDILFGGRMFDRAAQPWYYIPTLMVLQLTLPVLILGAVGAYALAGRRLAGRRWLEIAAIVVALWLPIAASFRPGSIVYNNFRQFLFTLPALFLLAALGLEQLLRWLGDLRWQGAAAALILLPGMVGIIRLHPYEYIYYNALAGTQGSVYSRFESDYWCTSYRAAAEWVDAHAAPGAVVEVDGAGNLDQILPFTRSDLQVVRLGSARADHPAPTWAIVCDGKGGELDLLPGQPAAMQITRGGAVLGEVKTLTLAP